MAIIYNTTMQVTMHVLMILPTLVIGLACGGLAVLFTVINLKVWYGMVWYYNIGHVIIFVH